MKGLGIVLGVTATLVTLCSPTVSEAATRARFRAETVLNDPAVRISAGASHTCQVNEDGTVRCWGANNVGQLGTGLKSTGPTRIPVLVSGLTTAIAIAAGFSHTCALLANGTVRCWGDNPSGQLGEGITGQRLVPVAVVGITTAVAIAAGASHTCALLTDGSVRCWGANIFGQLGIGISGGNRLTPVPVITSPNTLLTTVVAIAAGGNHTCALLATGSVRCWGDNIFGQLGNNSTVRSNIPVAVRDGNLNLNLTTAIAIAAGFSHTCALLSTSGVAKCWGRNDTGQIGNGNNTNQLSAIEVGVGGTPSRMVNVAVITAGGSHTCVLLANGVGRCWGVNGSGQIGDGTIGTTRLFPVIVGVPGNFLNNAVAITAGSSHTCALQADGSARCWGANQSGQLGISNTAPANTVPTTVLGGGGSVSARDIAAGRNHTCAVRANGTVACWGSNDSGQLGNNTTVSSNVPVTVITGPNLPLRNVVAIAAGEAHTCALNAEGTVFCWGDNNFGQLGIGSFGGHRPTPVFILGFGNVIAIAAGGTLGSSHTCALRANGSVHCWGSNGSGQLGNNSVLPRSSPVQVSGLANAVSIAVGEFHTCALLANGFPFCWGANNRGQLGEGTLSTRLTPIIVNLANTVAIAGGNTHTCALRVDGVPFCWGANLLGQLGINSTVSQSVLPTFVNLFNVIAVAGGFGHSCALVANGTASCWGDNTSGQLGNTTITTTSFTPVTVGRLIVSFSTFFSPLQGVVNLTTGRRHSCALLVSGGVVCWGENTVGQLGIGSNTNQVTPFTVPSFTLNIDPSVVLERNDRVSTVTILANCEAGRRLHVEVVLTQGAVSGHGVGSEECTGGLERYPVTVPAQGRDGYIDGPAQVSAEAVIRERGEIVEVQEWTRQVQVGSAP
jgi:alpha-tubulin suppressor-like RCC1 family protein